MDLSLSQLEDEIRACQQRIDQLKLEQLKLKLDVTTLTSPVDRVRWEREYNLRLDRYYAHPKVIRERELHNFIFWDLANIVDYTTIKLHNWRVQYIVRWVCPLSYSWTETFIIYYNMLEAYTIEAQGIFMSLKII